jgi:hypothetical protein
MLHACLYTICFVFCYTSWCFYAFFRTNPLMRCHSASSLFLLFLCFRKVLHRKYSRNWTTQKPEFLFFSKRHGVQSRDGGVPGGGRTMAWRGPPPGPHSNAALPPIYSPRRENLKTPDQFPQNILQATTIIDARSGGSRSSSRHPAGEGNHHRRPSSLPCLPSE